MLVSEVTKATAVERRGPSVWSATAADSTSDRHSRRTPCYDSVASCYCYSSCCRCSNRVGLVVPCVCFRAGSVVLKMLIQSLATRNGFILLETTSRRSRPWQLPEPPRLNTSSIIFLLLMLPPHQTGRSHAVLSVGALASSVPLKN